MTAKATTKVSSGALERLVDVQRGARGLRVAADEFGVGGRGERGDPPRRAANPVQIAPPISPATSPVRA